MAKYEDQIRCDFDALAGYLNDHILSGSISASLEDESRWRVGDIQCVTRVYERYSMMGGNRLSLTLTLFGRDSEVHLSAITAGGSQAMFFKINTFGESAFLDKLIEGLKRFKREM